MKGNEFVGLVRDNNKCDRIARGTEFRVYDKDNIYVCTVGVIRTSVAFLDVVNDLPVDLYTENYTFVEQKD